MAKKNAVQDVSTPEKRAPAPGPTPLLVIAGLPEMTALPAAATINNNSRTRWRAIASVFTNRDRGIYGEPSAIPVGSRHWSRDRDSEPGPCPRDRRSPITPKRSDFGSKRTGPTTSSSCPVAISISIARAALLSASARSCQVRSMLPGSKTEFASRNSPLSGSLNSTSAWVAREALRRRQSGRHLRQEQPWPRWLSAWDCCVYGDHCAATPAYA